MTNRVSGYFLEKTNGDPSCLPADLVVDGWVAGVFSNVPVVFSAAQDARDVFCLDWETCSSRLVIRAGSVAREPCLLLHTTSAWLGAIPRAVLQVPLTPALSTTHVCLRLNFNDKFGSQRRQLMYGADYKMTSHHDRTA